MLDGQKNFRARRFGYGLSCRLIYQPPSVFQCSCPKIFLPTYFTSANFRKEPREPKKQLLAGCCTDFGSGAHFRILTDPDTCAARPDTVARQSTTEPIAE